MAGQSIALPSRGQQTLAVLAFAAMEHDTSIDTAALLDAFGAEGLALWHGSVAGFVCGAPAEVAHRFIYALDLPDGSTLAALTGAVPPAPATGEAVQPSADTLVGADLERVIGRTVASLEEGGADFQPLLSDETALSERALALGQWCQGFLYGLANTTRRDLLEQGELGEVLQDFAQISQAARGEEESEVAENAYAELVEFVRVGVLLCFEALRGERDRWPAADASGESVQ